MYDIVPTFNLDVTSRPEAPVNSLAPDQASRDAMALGSQRVLRDNIEAAVTSNHMRNTADVFHDARALAGDNPVLAQMLIDQVRRFAVKQP